MTSLVLTVVKYIIFGRVVNMTWKSTTDKTSIISGKSSESQVRVTSEDFTQLYQTKWKWLFSLVLILYVVYQGMWIVWVYHRKKKRPTPNNSPFAKWELRDFLVMS